MNVAFAVTARRIAAFAVGIGGVCATARAQYFVQTAQVFPGDATTDYFGWSIDADGTHMVVGAPKTGTQGQALGSAFAYTWQGDAWLPDGSLIDPAPTANSEFGTVVALSGTTALVANRSGAGSWPRKVEAYRRIGNGAWNSIGQLNIPMVVDGGEFGAAIAMSKNVIAVGGATMEGRDVVVLYDTADVTTHTAIIEEPQTAFGVNRKFGWSLALDGDDLLIAARGDDELGTDAGAAYVFHRTSGSSE
ncbi:MAG TPA: FG-GAP repeat protein, partial [Flavobacteriales bacterium]|nr:FG-GAP repeat protein [Flavobacteriales bacterium]